MRARTFVAATAAAFGIATLAWTAPLLPQLRTAYLLAGEDPSHLARADAMLTSWMLAWAAHAMRTSPLDLFHANILHPLPWTFAFSENLLASALLVLPVDLLVGDPVLDHNLVLLASFVLAGTGTALLVRELGGSLPAAWLAGALVAFNTFRFASIGHIQTLSTHWMPFALLALHRCLGTGRGAVAVAAATLAVSLGSVYFAYFFFVALGVFLVAHRLLGCPAAPGGRVRAVAGIVAAGALTAAAFVPYVYARDMYALLRTPGEAWFLSARLTSYLGALADPVAYAARRYGQGEYVPIVLGPATWALLALGVVAGAAARHGGRRIAGVYLAVGVALALVSLGPLMQWSTFSRGVPGPWLALGAAVPGFAALRVPFRACAVAVLAAAVLAGLGAQACWRRARTPRARAAVAVLLAAVAVLEGWRGAFVVQPVAWAEAGPPPVYRWLAAQPRHPIVELPVGMAASDAEFMVMSAAHWKPLVNGYSGFTPTMSFFRGVLFHFPRPRALQTLHAIGVRWVVVHTARVHPAQAGLCALPASAVAPYAAVVYRDALACVYEIRGAPPRVPPLPDRPVPLAGAIVTTASGAPADAAIDGRLDTHFVEPVVASAESWLRLDLPAAHAVTRVVLVLGPHFGEYLRLWRIETSADGVTWETVASDVNGEPPLRGLRRHPDNLRQELRLPAPTRTRHLRIVRQSETSIGMTVDLWANWRQWGVHELRVFAAPP